jgi:hypothetical protein
MSQFDWISPFNFVVSVNLSLAATDMPATAWERLLPALAQGAALTELILQRVRGVIATALVAFVAHHR